MIKPEGSEIRILTPDLAEEFATMQGTIGERKLRTERVKFLRHKLEDGLFHSPKWAIAKMGGTSYRVNGQHSATMLAESNGAFPHGLSVIIDKFSCDTNNDMSELFAQFDSPGSCRTKIEVINSCASIHEDLRDMDRSLIGACVSGMAMALTDNKDSARGSIQDSAKLVHTKSDFIIWAIPILKNRMIRRTAFLCAMFLTWRVESESAIRFWELVSSDSHPDVSHPTRVLSRFVLSLPRRGQSITSMRFRDRAIAAKCIHAWNAYRKNRTTDLKYHADAPFPYAV